MIKIKDKVLNIKKEVLIKKIVLIKGKNKLRHKYFKK
jgi:hypothetical protein